MAELIDPTWIAWRTDPCGGRRPASRLERVRDHYAPAAAPQAEIHSWSAGGLGLAVLADPAPAHRWPHFAAGEGRAIATAYLPWGWRTLADRPPEPAPLELAEVIAARPGLVASHLDPPAVVAVGESEPARVLIANDRLGAGRLYEAGFDGLQVWSNRVGAIPIIAGERPEASERGWKLFAALGWFARTETSIEGVTRVRPGTVIELSAERVTRTETGAIGALVAATEASFERRVERFAADALAGARAAGELFDAPAAVDLSGGRDSRLAAAAVIAAGIPARLLTSDMTPGEADVARELVGRLEAPVEHEIRWRGGERKSYDKGLRERALANHLIHDGMRHAAKLRGKMSLPAARPAAATVTGHGGEIAHGFYYSNRRQLTAIERAGASGPLERLLAAARRRHGGATDDAYTLAREEIEASLAEGSAHGLDGPELLDWFYLMERFAHRSGLASDATRLTFFARAPFVAAAFAMSAEERLDARLHREAIARLQPAWERVGFFAKAKPRRSPFAWLRRRRLPDERRALIWEGVDAPELEAMLDAGGPWERMFDPERARELWHEARAGRGDAHYQDVFEAIAYRSAFEDHLGALARAAGG